jgi:hypothetical protein
MGTFAERITRIPRDAQRMRSREAFRAEGRRDPAPLPVYTAFRAAPLVRSTIDVAPRVLVVQEGARVQVAAEPVTLPAAPERAAIAATAERDPLGLTINLERASVYGQGTGLYRLAAPYVPTTAGPAKWAGACMAHGYAMSTTTVKGARAWRDEAAAWCPGCISA